MDEEHGAEYTKEMCAPRLPAHLNVLQPKLPIAVHIRQKEVKLKASSKFNFDRKHRSKERPPLTVGDKV